MKIKTLYPLCLSLALFSFVNLRAYSQKGVWKPFKLLIIQPDTAIVDAGYENEKDTIQAINLRAYYAEVKQMEDMLTFKDYSKDMDSSFKETKAMLLKELPLVKAQEDIVKKFRYFQTISQYSAQVYNFYFNEYEPFSSIYEIPAQDTTIPALKILADTSKADYVVYYNNIHSNKKDGLPILKLATSLYSAREGKIIMHKETEGDINSRGDMWSCSTELMCLLINGVHTSTDEVVKILYQLQINKSKITR